MEITEVLEKIGLKDKEAGVYLAVLELGTASVESIARKAGTKRPTTYLVLDDLESKGLVSIVPYSKKHLYTAETPEFLLTDLAKKHDLVKTALPNLLAIFNARKEKPQVQLFSGKEGVRQVYHKIFETDSVWFFGTIREISKIDPDALEQFVRRVKSKQLSVRDFLSPTKADFDYAAKAKFGGNYEIKFLPNTMNFPNDSAIFGSNVVFFSFQPQVFAVMITSNEISQSLRALYELAWQNALPYEKVVVK